MSTPIFNVRLDENIRVKCKFLLNKSEMLKKYFFAEMINKTYDEYYNSEDYVSEL